MKCLHDEDCFGELGKLIGWAISTLVNLKNLECNGNRMTALDITHNANLTNLKCGNQEESLTLTLLDTQKTLWNKMAVLYQDDNSNVNTLYTESCRSRT